MIVIIVLCQSHLRTQVYYNSKCCLDMRATCFDLYFDHLQAHQYKNLTKKNIIKILWGPLLTVTIFYCQNINIKLYCVEIFKKCLHNDFTLFRSSFIVERVRMKILLWFLCIPKGVACFNIAYSFIKFLLWILLANYMLVHNLQTDCRKARSFVRYTICLSSSEIQTLESRCQQWAKPGNSGQTVMYREIDS
jgi:hypothetical protein